MGKSYIERKPIVCAADLPLCDCCEEPWCPVHQLHYADCDCIGPHNAEDLGYTVVERKGKLYAERRVTRLSGVDKRQ